MDSNQALHTFWASHGLPAIDELSAYDKKVLEQLKIGFPRITYEVAAGTIESDNLLLTGKLWYKSTSWAEITQKAEQIAKFIGYGGKTYKLDNGYLKIMLPRGQKYRRSLDESDGLRCIVFNIEVAFLTAT